MANIHTVDINRLKHGEVNLGVSGLSHEQRERRSSIPDIHHGRPVQRRRSHRCRHAYNDGRLHRELFNALIRIDLTRRPTESPTSSRTFTTGFTAAVQVRRPTRKPLQTQCTNTARSTRRCMATHLPSRPWPRCSRSCATKTRIS